MPDISIVQSDNSTFSLKSEVRVPRPIGEVFTFFSDARNLEKLTPNSLRFKIFAPCPLMMQVGTLIDYSIRIHGMPLRWRSEIVVWEPPFRFVDEQLRGPYKTWIHEHKFVGLDGHTLVSDKVDYCPRVSWLTYKWVERDLKKIFEYRHQKLSQVFGLTKKKKG